MIESVMTEPIELIKRYIASGVFPGASFAIIDKGQVKKYHFGDSCLKPEKVRLVPDMAYDLASVSKVVGTGTVVINLILSKKIVLDGLLTDYYPEFVGKGAESLTIRQLLTHTSGIDPFIKNRDQLGYAELRAALNRVDAVSEKSFHYSDVNFILLGFMLESIYQQKLSIILQQQVFTPFEMSQTGFVAPENTVPTAFELPRGGVHDPKAQVLGEHIGSAGLFSTLDDLIRFSKAYFRDERYQVLLATYSLTSKKRSLAWDLLTTADGEVQAGNAQNQWLLHTGYTGTFIMLNLRTQQAVIFLSNRVHLHDNRSKWILDRNVLIDVFAKKMKMLENC